MEGNTNLHAIFCKIEIFLVIGQSNHIFVLIKNLTITKFRNDKP